MKQGTAEGGHVVGMLDRDQRTVKMCSFDRHVVLVRVDQTVVLTQRNKTISHRSVPGRTSPHSSCKTRKNGHFWKSLHRLKHALIVAAYLSLVTFPSILTAPTSMSSREEPKWWNPCGLVGNVNGSPGTDHHVPDDKDVVDLILKQAKIAQQREDNFPTEFAKNAFSWNLKQLEERFVDQEYEWLPARNISKKYKHDVPDEELQNLELESTVVNIYEYLQRIAVGVEQMVFDEEDRGLKSQFVQIQTQLNNLLCEFHTVIIEKNFTSKGNVPREIMGDEFRNMKNHTSTCTRNWIIYRNYLNMLDYIIQVFNHFKTTLP